MEKVRAMKHSGLIRILEKQLEIHTKLYDLAIKKVDIVKKGKIEALNELMKEEQKLISAIQMMENEREKELGRLYPAEEKLPTISQCIQMADQEEGPILQHVYEQLLTTLQKMKQQNELNQQLIENSLQFVNFSLQLLRPRPESLTYNRNMGKPTLQDGDAPSLFNSEA
ncbi:flagellar protein FlgN [Fervidibacillus halotolerans]|uniref:Flagellar protein FlgN n=1 Tax=Fervidibacillus halotolerans TaxID=2980027 RepID=A0A9E8LYD0_9BACI|nr:flagellar protein FlgN [Fervidibacillus halotolerans]WAA12028.1 flagellar protein FlgN [Fervidibacillus halotolerans]